MAYRDPTQVLSRLGGSGTLAQLDEVCSRAEVRRAVRQGDVVRLARGRYALPAAPDPRVSAVRLAGVVSHESAATIWGIEIPTTDPKPHVTVCPQRARLDRREAVVHWARLSRDEIVDGVTSPLRTVLDLARDRTFSIGLAAADSALRRRLVESDELASQARELRGNGCRTARLVARHADGRAESPLESVLRSIVIQARVRGFDPQLQIDADGFRARVDLGDPRRRIVIEADSFAHHGHRSALARDCRRYTELTLRGWRVLRFAWEHVMFEPEWVAACVLAAIAG
ncbi:DUF559 domain-containing protein [Angustibacter sp. McL0619]|uniref:DUF559 domain-containing protein n=1 Tax=Angustibacter sp. McL0619 TaxID=3415676 RepID=UPI003CEA066E